MGAYELYILFINILHVMAQICAVIEHIRGARRQYIMWTVCSTFEYVYIYIYISKCIESAWFSRFVLFCARDTYDTFECGGAEGALLVKWLQHDLGHILSEPNMSREWFRVFARNSGAIDESMGLIAATVCDLQIDINICGVFVCIAFIIYFTFIFGLKLVAVCWRHN